MRTIVKNRRVPKPVLETVLDDYKTVVDNIDGIIKGTGYKMDFIARKMDMPISTFYMKKRTRTFTYNEVTQIVGMLDDDESVENAYLLELAESRLNDETVGIDELLKALNDES